MGKTLKRIFFASCLYRMRAEAFSVAPLALRAGASRTPAVSSLLKVLVRVLLAIISFFLSALGFAVAKTRCSLFHFFFVR
jgi:hypothetical protein